VRYSEKLPRCWYSRLNKAAHIFYRMLCHLLLSSSTFAYANAEEVVGCPVIAPSMSVFSSARIYSDSTVTIEKNSRKHKLYLSLYRRDGENCKKTIFATYSREGGDPIVDSLFFFKLKGSVNLFVIVHWDVNSRGIGTFGRIYQVYAYGKDSIGGLKENEFVINDDSMTGMDGYQDGVQVVFLYKNATAVKYFFECGRSVCE
jgi:hypothetical protein